MNTNAMVQGSLGAIAKKENCSIAETFVSCDIVCIVDTSGSMDLHDSRENRTRYDVACEELRDLQNTLPGKIGVIAFSSDVVFCPGGVPVFLRGGTDMAKALRFAKVADVPGMHFIMISDGWPDSEAETLEVAKTYTNKVDVIYVGPEGGRGQDFLKRLAEVTGGSRVTAYSAKELKAGVIGLLNG